MYTILKKLKIAKILVKVFNNCTSFLEDSVDPSILSEVYNILPNPIKYLTIVFSGRN